MIYIWIAVLFTNGHTLNIKAHYPGVYRENGQMTLAMSGIATCEGHVRNLLRYSMDFYTTFPPIKSVNYNCGVEL